MPRTNLRDGLPQRSRVQGHMTPFRLRIIVVISRKRYNTKT